MRNFETRKESSGLLAPPTSKYEVSIELENLQKNIDRLKESLDALEIRIRPILKQKLNEVDEIQKNTSSLVELAMRISEVNKQLSIYDIRIINMIDSCQL